MKKAKLTFEEFKKSILEDYRIICESREASLLGRKEVLTGKAKFGILLDEIKHFIKENNIKGIVVGNPINMDGSKGPSAQSANDFAKYLSNNISISVTMWDERLSSEAAFNLSSNLDINTSKKVEKLDQNAASFILQGAIDYIKR